MIETSFGSWTVLLLLGGLHGINPGMGWLFAVALGLQEEDGRAVWRSLVPLAIGHGLAIAVAIVLTAAAGVVFSPGALQWIVAGALFGMGVFHLRSHRHPRWGGMRVGIRELVLWSFLMATAHGAGLMALPFVPEPTSAAEVRATALHAAPPEGSARPHAHGGGGSAGGADHRAHLPGSSGGRWVGLLATLIHTLGYLLVTGTVAAVVYYRLGLRLLRRAWLNLNAIWAGALMATAVLILLV